VAVVDRSKRRNGVDEQQRRVAAAIDCRSARRDIVDHAARRLVVDKQHRGQPAPGVLVESAFKLAL
jgi:hypothetical protein